MKKLILSQLLISFLFIATSFGQTEKGSFLLGGNASFNLQPSKLTNLGSYKTLNFNPDFGYFIKNNLAIGIKVPLSYSGYNTDFYALTYGVSAFSRYYFAKTDRTSFFGSANIGMIGQDEKQFSYVSYNDVGFDAGLGLGFTIFLNKSIGFETELLYDYSKFNKNSVGYDNYGINFGFQIYFNKNNK